MRKLLLGVLLLSLVLSSVSCGSSREFANENCNDPGGVEDELNKTSEKEDAAKDINSSLDVDEGLLTVELSIPATFVENTTQEQVDESVKKKGFISGKLNSDGSVTYKMTKKQHKELIDSIDASIEDGLAGMISSGDYPNFIEIEHNDDYTAFTVKTTGSDLNLMESMTTLMFYMYGGMHSAFRGESVDNIHVDYINADSGEVVSSADSKNAGN